MDTNVALIVIVGKYAISPSFQGCFLKALTTKNIIFRKKSMNTEGLKFSGRGWPTEIDLETTFSLQHTA